MEATIIRVEITISYRYAPLFFDCRGSIYEEIRSDFNVINKNNSSGGEPFRVRDEDKNTIEFGTSKARFIAQQGLNETIINKSVSFLSTIIKNMRLKRRLKHFDISTTCQLKFDNDDKRDEFINNMFQIKDSQGQVINNKPTTIEGRFFINVEPGKIIIMDIDSLPDEEHSINVVCGVANKLKDLETNKLDINIYTAYQETITMLNRISGRDLD